MMKTAPTRVNSTVFRYHRVIQSLHQSDVEHFIGIDQSVLSLFEHGKYNLRPNQVRKLACLLSVPLAEEDGDE